MSIWATLAQPSREDGQRWAEDELSDPAYHEAETTLLARIGRAIMDFIDDLLYGASRIEHPALIVVVVLAVAGLIAAAVWFTRRSAGVPLERAPERPPVFVSELDPVVLRRTSGQAAESGDWQRAVQDLVRAVFAEQSEAGRIDIDRASTAHELATAAGEALPQASTAFAALGTLFDTVSFSGQETPRESYAHAVSLDAVVSRATPARVRGRATQAGERG